MKRLSLIGKSIQHHARQSRVLVRFPRSIDAIRDWRKRTVADQPFQKTCLIDVRQIRYDGEQGRRFHTLVNLLTSGGYQVWMVPRLGFMQSARKRFKWRALGRVHVYDKQTAPDQFDLCLTDSRRSDARAQRTMRLTHDAHRTLRDSELPMPYGFHPEVIDSLDPHRLEQLRMAPKPWRLFFGGNLQQDAYRKVSGYYHLKTVNRFKILALTLQHYGDRTVSPTDQASFETQLETEIDGFSFIDSDVYRTPAARWLETLGRSKFFVAAPGVNYPVSHNCVEALSVGSIPVLEYSQLFQPHLEHGVNCLVYKGEAEYRRTLRIVESLSEFEIEKLRRGAMAYYDQYLSAAAFAAQLESSGRDELHVFSYLTRPAA